MKIQYYIFLLITVLCINCEPEVPRCNDGFMNGDETEVDCGGSCGECYTCDDNYYNNGETDTDCGGPCTPCSNEWTAIYTNEPSSIDYIYTWDFSPDGLFGLIASRTSFIKKTSDGGQTWTEITLPESWQYMELVYVVDELNWYVQVDGWGVFRTENGGQSWNISSMKLYSMDFLDENYGVMHLGNGIYTTNDGGDNWIYQFDNNSFNGSIFSVQRSTDEYYHVITANEVHTGKHTHVGLKNSQDLPQGRYRQSVTFKGITGYAILDTYPRTIVKTEDAGFSWITLNDNINKFNDLPKIGLYKDNLLMLGNVLNANETEKWYEQRYTKGFYTKDGIDLQPIGLINENTFGSDCKIIGENCYCANGVAMYKVNLPNIGIE
ncbi:MAG: WD40/YVTN/BNR-like repeat-containing protein [Saprospiraceae bacterium]